MDYVTSAQALLFVAGEEGLSLDQLALLLEIERSAARQIIEELTERLQKDTLSALTILQTAEEYKLVTKKEYESLLKKYAVSPFTAQLSNASLETLAIIAYKQPITRLEIDQIRSVQSSGAIQKLLLHDLIEEAGRLDSPGRPKLYKTTKYFMDYFGLNTLEELPDVTELFALPEETQSLFKEERLQEMEEE